MTRRPEEARHLRRIVAGREAAGVVSSRIQRKRTPGWRMPEGAVYVGRPTYWGNPYRIGDPLPHGGRPMSRLEAVLLFRHDLEKALGIRAGTVDVRIVEQLADLRGRDLCCWCPLTLPCHADVLLELANS